MIDKVIENVIVKNMTSHENGYTFLHATKSWQNLIANDQALPAVYMDMPIKYESIELASGHIDIEYDLTFFFIFSAALDDTPEQHTTVFNKALEAQKEFQRRLSKEKDFIKKYTPGKSFQIPSEYNRIVGGVVFPVKIILWDFEPQCLTDFNPK